MIDVGDVRVVRMLHLLAKATAPISFPFFYFVLLSFSNTLPPGFGVKWPAARSAISLDAGLVLGSGLLLYQPATTAGINGHYGVPHDV
jgi:hypothetical protein